MRLPSGAAKLGAGEGTIMRGWRRWFLGGALVGLTLLTGCQPIIINESGSSAGSSS